MIFTKGIGDDPIFIKIYNSLYVFKKMPCGEGPTFVF